MAQWAKHRLCIQEAPVSGSPGLCWEQHPPITELGVVLSALDVPSSSPQKKKEKLLQFELLGTLGNLGNLSWHWWAQAGNMKLDGLLPRTERFLVVGLLGTLMTGRQRNSED